MTYDPVEAILEERDEQERKYISNLERDVKNSLGVLRAFAEQEHPTLMVGEETFTIVAPAGSSNGYVPHQLVLARDNIEVCLELLEEEKVDVKAIRKIYNELTEKCKVRYGPEVAA